MDYKWLLSFPYRLYRINLLFHLRRCAIGWTTFRTLGVGNSSVHCNVINCPWQSCPHHQVYSSKIVLILVYGRNGRYLRFQGRLLFGWCSFLYTPIVAPMLGFSQEYYGILPHVYTTLLFWASIVVIPVMCLIRDFAWK